MSAPQAADIIGDKEIYVSYKTCYRFNAVQGSTGCNIINDCQCEGYEEADTKIAFFVKNMRNSGDIVIQCSDTDIFVIRLGNMAHIPQLGTIWLLFGTGNNQRYINVTAVHEALSARVCQRFTRLKSQRQRCDFNPAFYRIGKKKPWKIFHSNENYQNAFAYIQKPADKNYKSSFRTIEEFVCKMYSTKKTDWNVVKVLMKRASAFLQQIIIYD